MDNQNNSTEEAQDADVSPRLGEAWDLLQKCLQENEGVISSKQLKQAFVTDLKVSEEDARDLLWELRYLNPTVAEKIKQPTAMTFHRNRSFYSEKKYQESEKAVEQEPDEQLEEKGSAIVSVRQNEESRVVKDVQQALKDIYESDFAPDDAEYVFDVHNTRRGSSFENVDLIAVHWRSDSAVELVTVEVKLSFSVEAVYQACSYARFSHRAWIACVVSDFVTENFLTAGQALQKANAGLFDYAVSQGIGILACRRGGRRYSTYQVSPIHWPRLQTPNKFYKANFLENYRDFFEKAQAVEPQTSRSFPRIM